MSLLLKCSVLLPCAFLIVGCQDDSTPSVPIPTKQEARDLNDQINKTLSDALAGASAGLDKLSPHAEQLSDAALQEVKKLSVIEYKVVDFSVDAPSDEVERKLAALGAERWECLSAVPSSTGTRVFCHRRPETYLRFIPRWIP